MFLRNPIDKGMKKYNITHACND